MRAIFAGTILAAAVAFPTFAHADEPSAPAPEPPPTVTTEPSAPSATPSEPAAEPVDAQKLGRFRALRLRYDAMAGEAYEGTSREPLARGDFYARLGRPDLAEKSSGRSTQRLLLFLGGGLVGAAGIASGLLVYSASPDMNAYECVRNGPAYNVCHEDTMAKNTLGGVLIMGGLLLGSGLVALGLNLSLDPLPPRQTESLVASYNGELLRKLKAPMATSPAPGSRLQITPQVHASGGGIIGRLTF